MIRLSQGIMIITEWDDTMIQRYRACGPRFRARADSNPGICPAVAIALRLAAAQWPTQPPRR